MKNFTVTILSLIVIISFSSCFHRKNDINVSVSENEKKFKFSAHFPENKTHDVGEIIDKNISPATFFSSGTVHVDATTTLDDKTSFYIKASPGNVMIEFDRYKNTKSSYSRVRDMCEEIKESLTK